MNNLTLALIRGCILANKFKAPQWPGVFTVLHHSPVYALIEVAATLIQKKSDIIGLYMTVDFNYSSTSVPKGPLFCRLPLSSVDNTHARFAAASIPYFVQSEPYNI